MEEKNDIFDHLRAGKTPVPDASYFANLTKSVIDSQNNTPIIPLYKRPIIWIGAAAAILVLSLFFVNLSPNAGKNSDPLVALNDVSSNEISNYINENIDDFDIDLITEALNERSIDELQFINDTANVQIQKTNQHSTSTKISFDDVNVDDILDYLKDQGIDAEDLEDEDSFI